MRQNQNEVTIRFATSEDTAAVIELWSICFPGDEEFRDYFFSRLYMPEQNLLLLCENKLCAMTQMLPYRMQNGSKTENITYIYGACTHPDFRRRHLMDMLLHRSFELDCEMGRTASVLIPQEAWLFDFYAQFGYAPTLFVSDHRYKEKPAAPACPLRSAQGEDLSAMDLLFHAHLWDGTYLCRDEKEWRKQLELFTNCGGEVLCAGPEGAPDGYAFVWCSETQIWAQELVCSTEMEQIWVAALMERYQKTDCTVTGLTFSSRQPLGCVLRYDGTQPAEGYINLMLN